MTHDTISKTHQCNVLQCIILTITILRYFSTPDVTLNQRLSSIPYNSCLGYYQVTNVKLYVACGQLL